MGGIEQGSGDIYVEDISDLSNEAQANKITEFFSSTRNQYDRLTNEDFCDYFHGYNYDECAVDFVSPQNIEGIISTLNKRSACVVGDIPMKIVNLF